MKRLFNSFRVRILFILALLLFGTLVVQYLLNLRAERQNARRIDEQTKALVAGIALGVKSIGGKEYIYQLRERMSEPLPGSITNILTVDEQWRVTDSLDDRYRPETNPDYDPNKARGPGNEQSKYAPLSAVTQFPPSFLALNLKGEEAPLPSTVSAANFTLSETEPRAFFIPVRGVTNDGREVTWYVIVVLGPPEASSGIINRQAAKPLIYTAAIFLVASLLAAVLVWKFTKPIKDLSNAASNVAANRLNFRVPSTGNDEMGQLVSRFNEMIAGLERARELETKLSQAEKSAVVGRLASGIAHEIRNPLNYINLTLDRLRTSYKPADESKQEKYQSHILNLKEEVKRINKQITDFLSYTRPRELDMRELDLREELRDALRIVEHQAAENGIKAEIHYNGRVPTIKGDQDSLRSVFTNLFINAVQAMGASGGELKVKVVDQDHDNRVRIEISDTGCGIPSEHIPKLFEPYFSTKETGTGLGLAIVKKNLEEHGGTIDVQSAPNEGTTFIVTLPTERESLELSEKQTTKL
jgi:signal transduction histidine kinase